MKEIEIIIDEETGEIQIETMCGITGISCEEILDKLQEAHIILNEAVSSLKSFPSKGGDFDQLRLTALRIGIGVKGNTEAMLEFKDVVEKLVER